MQATITTPNANNGRNYGGQKETDSTYTAVGLNAAGEITEAATLRIYTGRSRQATVVYASLWVHGGPTGAYVSGTAKAGGGGYCKRSAAASGAFLSAGIELSECVSGRGESAIEEAMKALGTACGYKGVVVVRS